MLSFSILGHCCQPLTTDRLGTAKGKLMTDKNEGTNDSAGAARVGGKPRHGG
jgi:hypothetical protein